MLDLSGDRFALSVDLEGNYELGDDPTGSLELLTYYEFCSPDEAVYLPGRNPLLLIKARLWCQMHGISRLAVGTLAANPFSDATDAFFELFESAMDQATDSSVQLLRPFATWTKYDVMRYGAKLPLHLTFSCLAPIGGGHCGSCNKCAERQRAFQFIDTPDPTPYAIPPQRSGHPVAQ